MKTLALTMILMQTALAGQPNKSFVKDSTGAVVLTVTSKPNGSTVATGKDGAVAYTTSTNAYGYRSVTTYKDPSGKVIATAAGKAPVLLPQTTKKP